MITKSVEDYLEAIYNLIEKKGYARTIDIANHLKIRSPSVTEMLQKLDKEGFIIYEKYRGIKLTSKGEEIAKSVKKRHEILARFLEILGVEREIAEENACSIEHSVHPETMERLSKFVEFVSSAPKDPKWLKHFEHYVRTGEHPECE
ncbi:MAG: transcriptional regulator MntR [Candidatus Syntropharchaeia archaeon]